MSDWHAQRDQGLLAALLQPIAKLRDLDISDDFTSRLALLEELKTLPFGAVWDEYCRRKDVPSGAEWLSEVKAYERKVVGKRG